MSEYIKKTKLNTNVAEMALFILKEINEKLKAKGWSRCLQNNDFVFVKTDKFPYCWDVIKLIQKHLSDDKWECKMTHYVKTNDAYLYTWNFSIKK